MELRDRCCIGTQSNGQGHEIVYAQMLHDQLGLPVDAVEVVQGDSDPIGAAGPAGPGL